MELLAIAEDEDVQDYTDPVNGRDLTVEKLDAAAVGNSYGKTNIRVRTKVTPLSERADQVEAWLNDQEKLLYTLYLVEEIDMLGKECYAKEDGYSNEVIENTVKYLRDNYRYMYDFNDNSTVSPRSAIKLADTITNFPNEWKMMADMQFIKMR
jgi:hypothetical protein